ncbi:MAG: CPBP family intramembrane metalloprotease [Xanthomonadales bacterium]|nr:CPBP family intramembrane metalloprotease [Xanthomonadales bacterium]
MPPSAVDADGNSRGGLLLPMAVVFALTIAAQLLSLAFGRIDETRSFSSTLLPSLVYLSVLTIPAAWVGIVLGRRTGLGMPAIDALLSGQPGAARRLRAGILPAAILGLLLGGLLLALRVVCEPYLPPELPQLGFRGVVGGLAVSVGAAVGEEVWFRFGLMTLLVWVGARIRGTDQLSVTGTWLVVLITAIGFGTAHLPQLVAYGAGAPAAIIATVLGNVAVGILYGWLYWRRGLIAAVVAHFSVDLVLHVLSTVTF